MIEFEWQNTFDPGDSEFFRVPDPFPGIVPPNPDSPFFANNEDPDYGPGDSILGLEVEKVAISRCHICVTFNYTIGFLNYPSSTICYIRPECQPEPPQFFPSIECLNNDSFQAFFEELNQAVVNGYEPKAEDIPPYCDQTPDIPEGDGSRIIEIKIWETYYTGYTYQFTDGSGFSIPSRTSTVLRYQVRGKDDFKIVAQYSDPKANEFGVRRNDWFVQTFAISGTPSAGKTYQNSQGILLFVRASDAAFSYQRSVSTSGVVSSITFTSGGFTTRIEINGVPLQLPEPPPPRPPEPPNDQDDDPMNCCPEILRRLRQIQDDLILLMRWTGAKPGQIKVPSTFLNRSPGSNWLSNLVDLLTPNEVTLKSLPEYFKWQMEREQEWLGQWPAMWADKDGNEVGYPNLAIAISELARQLAYTKSQGNLTQMAVLKTLLEVGLNRHNGILVASTVEAILDWLEVPTEEYQREVRHQFVVPNDGSIDPEDVDTLQEVEQFLQNDTHYCAAVKLSDKKINGKAPDTFGTTAQRIFKILEMLESQHLKVDKNNIEQGLKDYLIQYLKNTGKINDGEEDSDLPQWLDKVERQFGTEPNPPDGAGEKPWGGSVEERPRIIVRGDNLPE